MPIGTNLKRGAGVLAALCALTAAAVSMTSSARATEGTATLTNPSTSTAPTPTPPGTATPPGTGGSVNPVRHARGYTGTGRRVGVPVIVSRPGTLTIQLFVKARHRGAKLIAYGKKTIRVQRAGRVLVHVKPTARLARRYTANPRNSRYSGRATLTVGKQRFVLRFAVRVIKSKYAKATR